MSKENKPRELPKCDECDKDGQLTDGLSLWLCFEHAIYYCQERLDEIEKTTYCKLCKKEVRGDYLFHCSMEHYEEVKKNEK